MEIYLGHEGLAGKALHIPEKMIDIEYFMPFLTKVERRGRLKGIDLHIETGRGLYERPLRNYFRLGLANEEGVVAANFHQVFHMRPVVQKLDLQECYRFKLEGLIREFKALAPYEPVEIGIIKSEMRDSAFEEFRKKIENELTAQANALNLLKDYNLFYDTCYAIAEAKGEKDHGM